MTMTEMEAVVAPTARTRTLPPRDARGRFLARSDTASEATRVRPQPRDVRRRVLPSRDARGGFVAFPTTSAPSWYVLCADGYRVPGEAEMMPVPVSAPPAPPPQQPLPAACVVRRPHFGMPRDQI